MRRAFISYSRKNIAFAERLARDISDAGLDVWIDFRNIQGGNVWQEAIFDGINQSDIVIVCLSPDAIESEWVRRELLMSRSQHKFIFPLTVTKCFDLMPNYEETRFLLDIQSIDFEKFGYEQSFPRLLNALQGYSTVQPRTNDKQVDPQNIVNPFKGLEAFQQTDAHLFFGRERLVEKLIGRIDKQQHTHFLAVVGASGSGKSSLVRAGLIPAIRSGKISGSETWTPIILTPGAHPVETLATRLLPLITGNRLLPEIVKILNEDKNALHLLVEGMTITTNSGYVVLVVDQFEELFTQAVPVEAQHFIDLICTVANHAASRMLIVATLRADFFGSLSKYSELALLFEQDNMIIVTEMSSDNLRKSIEGPADAVGLVYEDELPDRILDDVRQQPGSLPLLEYALKELYEHRDGRTLTIKAYEQIGGVQRALAGHADGIYDKLSPSQQAIMRRILLRLVKFDDVGNISRRRMMRNELFLHDIPIETVQQVIDLMTGAQSRLLIASRDIQSGIDENQALETEPVIWIEICHEALIREWKRLRDWITQDRESLRYSGELMRMANEWKNAGHNTEYLLIGRRLVQAEAWLTDADANNLQREFISAGLKIKHRQQFRQEMFRRVSLMFTGGVIAMATYVFASFDTQNLFLAEAIGKSTSIGVVWGILIVLLVIFTDTLPRLMFRSWWARLLLSVPTGIVIGTLMWGAFTWFFLNYDPIWEVMIYGGIGLALGFIVSGVFKLAGWVAFLITAVATYIPIYLMFDFYNTGVSPILPLSKDLLNNPAALMYFRTPEQIFTFGIPFVIIIALLGHGEAVWNDVKRLRHRIAKKQ